MYAVIETGGKQYRVKQNDTLQVERIKTDVGAEAELDTVLAISDGKKLQIGAPHVDKAKVVVKVLDHIRGKKLVSFKKKRRKGQSCKKGHRQELTVLQVQSIQQ